MFIGTMEWKYRWISSLFSKIFNFFPCRNQEIDSKYIWIWSVQLKCSGSCFIFIFANFNDQINSLFWVQDKSKGIEVKTNKSYTKMLLDSFIFLLYSHIKCVRVLYMDYPCLGFEPKKKSTFIYDATESFFSFRSHK